MLLNEEVIVDLIVEQAIDIDDLRLSNTDDILVLAVLNSLEILLK